MQEFIEPRSEPPAIAVVAGDVRACKAAALSSQQQQAFADSRCGGQQRLLLHECDAQAIASLQLTIIELQRARDYLEQRGFAGTVAANEADSFAGQHGKTRTVEKWVVAIGEMGIDNCD